MDAGEALKAVAAGKAVSRRAWNDPDRILRAGPRADVGGQPGPPVAIPSGEIALEDLRADDWFVVGSLN